MALISAANDLDTADDAVFRRAVFIVLGYTVAHAGLYYYLDARLTALVQIVGVILFTPSILLLERLNFPNLARHTFLLSGLGSLYAATVGIRVDLDIDYYYFAGIIAVLVLFKPQQYFQIGFGVSLCVGVWVMGKFGPLPLFSEYWVPLEFPSDPFKVLNFLGAILIVGLFFRYFVSLLQANGQRLAEISERQDYILEGAGLGAWDWSLASGQVHYDRRWCEILGLTSENRGDTLAFWESRVHPSDLSKVMSARNAFISGFTSAYECIYRMKHENSTWIWVLDRARISERSSDGRILCVTGTQLDITRLKESEALLRNIQKIAKIGAWELDVATGKTQWSEATFQIYGLPLGISPDQQSSLKYYMPAERGRVSDSITQCSEGKSFRETFEFMDYKGVHKWVEVAGDPVWDSGGRVTKIRGTLQDVSVQKKAQMELESRSKELNNFFSLTLDILCIAGSDGIFKKANGAFSQLLGFSEEELLSRPFIEFVHPEDVAATLLEVEKLSRGIKTIRFENRYRCSDGSYRVLNWTAAPDPETGVIYAAGHDLTEVRRQESALKQMSSAISRCAIVATTDIQGKIVSANENFCKISGYTESELIGQDHRLINSGVHSKRFFGELWKTISSGRVWMGEIQNRAKNGSAYYVQTVISPLLGLDGAVESYLAIRFDLTQQKESKLRLEEAQKVAKLGSWSFEVTSSRFQWSLQMFSLFHSHSNQEEPSLEQHMQDVHPEDRALKKEAFENCLKNGTPYRIRYRSVYPDKDIWIESRARATKNSAGVVIELSGTCQDVTELVKAEEQAKVERAKSALVAKLASLGEISAGIAHEINNPLAIISGAAAVLPKILGDPVKLGARVQSIQKAAERISKIVMGLKKYSRSSDGSDRRPVCLAKIVEEVSLLTESKSKRGFTPVSIECRTSALINCDEIEIEQVLINLINNAIDAVKDLEERWVRVTLEDELSCVVLRISDSGKGIDPKLVEKLFQPFFTTKAVGEGTGLGLSIAKGILDDHGATIEVLAHFPNTCFEIRFPRSEAKTDAV